jgi:general secretion pathway protein K
MRRGRPPNRSLPRNGGFALLIVLWTLALIAFLVLHLTASGHTEIRIADNLVDNAVAAAAADGAISEAIFNQSNPKPEQRWPLNGTAHALTIGNNRVVVRLEDEASRINPSLASPALMEGLFRALGNDPESARRFASAIADWVGSAPMPRPQEALFADYRAAGLDYGPPGAPFETLDELGRVLGMTPALFATVQPHLTLFGPAEPNRTGSDPVVTAALATIPQLGQAAPPASAAPTDLLTVRISAAAPGSGNARATRVAIVRVGSTLPQGYAVLSWGSGSD